MLQEDKIEGKIGHGYDRCGSHYMTENFNVLFSLFFFIFPSLFLHISFFSQTGTQYSSNITSESEYEGKINLR